MSGAPRGDSPDSEEPLSPRVLAEIREVGGDTLVREVLEIFLERTPERLRAADEALDGGDLAAAAKAFHSLRSAAGTVGALRLAEHAGRLERLALGGGGDELGEALASLRREADEALAASRRRAG